MATTQKNTTQKNSNVQQPKEGTVAHMLQSKSEWQKQLYAQWNKK